MCLYPRLMRNPKYTKTKKNGGVIPRFSDERVLSVPVACGKCIECRRAKAREWTMRLFEQLKDTPDATFITLTFDDEHYTEIEEMSSYNEFAANEIKLFIKRIVKQRGRSIKHWIITELGHEGTERLHLHGILFEKIEHSELEKLWGRGFVHCGEYCNEKTINYIVKYVFKTDNDHKNYVPKIFASKGIGSGYLKRSECRKHTYQEKEETNETYQTPDGRKINLPIYFRNKIYTEDQREKLWLKKIETETRFVKGQQISIKGGNYREYINALKWAQRKNEAMGYGSNGEWKSEDYIKKAKKICK